MPTKDLSVFDPSKVSLESWRPMDYDSELTLCDLHNGEHIFHVIAHDFPDHGHHWIRSISRCLDGSLLIQCSCQHPFRIPR